MNYTIIELNTMKKLIWPIFFVLNIVPSYNMFSQILTFEFSGYSGNEASGTSNTNNSGINSTNSVITRGSGLSASSNGNRFNAKSHQLGSSVSDAISGNNYFELVLNLTQAINFHFINRYNFSKILNRSQSFALRSSLDSYASDLGSAQTILDNTSSQSFTLHFHNLIVQVRSLTDFILIMLNLLLIRWLEGSGNDIVVNGSVSSTGSSITWTDLHQLIE